MSKDVRWNVSRDGVVRHTMPIRLARIASRPPERLRQSGFAVTHCQRRSARR